MFHILTSEANRDNDLNVEGCGGYWDSDDVYGTNGTAPPASNAARAGLSSGIVVGGNRQYHLNQSLGFSIKEK